MFFTFCVVEKKTTPRNENFNLYNILHRIHSACVVIDLNEVENCCAQNKS